MLNISLYVSYGDLFLVMGNNIAQHWSVKESAEVLHDLMRSSNKGEYFLGLCDTVPALIRKR